MILDISWNDFKSQITSKGLRYSHVADKNDSNAYHLWTTDGSVTLYCLLVGDERDEFISTYLSSSGKRFLVGNDVLLASPLTLMSPSLCDRTSWWFDSAMIKDEALGEISGTSWQASHTNIIDLEHAKVCLEDDVAGTARSASPMHHGTRFSSTVDEHFLIPLCKVYDGSSLLATLVRTDDTSPAFGEYCIDYVAGTIVTGDSWTGKSVKLSYHYARTSKYEFIPDPGRLIRLGHTEVNARNVDFNAHLPVVFFEIWVGATLKVRRIYKHVNDYTNQSVAAPQVWEDWCFPQWPYKLAETANKDATIAVKSSANMKIRLVQEDDSVEWSKKDTSGAAPYLSVALHCISEVE